MAISKRKMEANRHNARKSTGPRTAAGKKRSSGNALKHGMTSKTVLLRGFESPKVFKRLSKGSIKTYKPKGTVEKNLVQQLAVCDQQAQRGLRFERNELEKTARSARKKFLRKQRGWRSRDKKSVERAKKKAGKRDWLRLPTDPNTLEIVGRYQTTIDRRYDRLLERLLKLQGLRKERAARRRAAHGK